MKPSKKTIITIIIALICVIGVVIALSIPKRTDIPASNHGVDSSEKSQDVIIDNGEEGSKPESGANHTHEVDPTANDENINGLDKPIFMYFVTNADLENKDTKATLDRLQAEYKDTVIFDIKNADEDKTLYDNFPIKDSMPMLIMQKKGGDIANFLFSNNNYDELKAAIDATL